MMPIGRSVRMASCTASMDLLRAMLNGRATPGKRTMLRTATMGTRVLRLSPSFRAAAASPDRSRDGCSLADAPSVDGPLVDGPFIDGPFADGPFFDARG